MPTQSAGPIFIVGSMGSGTTLMRLILDSHDDIAIAQETGFARALLANEWIPFDQFGGDWYERIGWTKADLETELGRFYSALFARFAAQLGAARWGDKTPFHVWHVALLARVFPDAVFVATVRHPGAVATSVHRRMNYSWRWSVRHWARANLVMVHQGAALGERFLACRYEDLVTDPEPLLRELFARLGVPWSDVVLDFHRVHNDRGTPREVEGQTRSDRPFDTGRVGAWTSGLTEERRRLLRRRRVAGLSTLFGYAPDAPLPTGPLAGGSGAGLLVDGDGLARLIAEHPAVSDTKLPRPTLANRTLRRQDMVRMRKRKRKRAARRPRLVGRLCERVGALAGSAGRRLPPDARRRVRSLAQQARR